MRTLGRRPASISFAEPWHVSQLTPDFTCNPCGKTTLAGKRLVNVNGISLASESAFSKASFSGESLNVAVHTVHLGRHPGSDSGFRTRMALGAVQPEGFPVFFMVKRKIGRIFVNIIGESHQIPYDKTTPAQSKDNPQDREWSLSFLQTLPVFLSQKINFCLY